MPRAPVRRGPKSRESSVQEPESPGEHSYLIKKSDSLGRTFLCSTVLRDRVQYIVVHSIVHLMRQRGYFFTYITLYFVELLSPMPKRCKVILLLLLHRRFILDLFRQKLLQIPGGKYVTSSDPRRCTKRNENWKSCPGLFAGLSRLLFANSADLPTANRCEKCQWPLCSNKCKGLYRRHGHSKEECEQLTTCPVSSTQLPNNQLFNAITPLRCLLLKLNQPEQWTTLISMEAHNDVRRKLPSVWDYNQKTVVDRITQDWKITAFSPEEIHTVCGVLEVNAFAVGEDSLSIRGLYPTAFYIAHSCVPNTSHTDDEEFRMKVFTSVQVAKDEMITLSYTNSLQFVPLFDKDGAFSFNTNDELIDRMTGE
ncbi:hypothetical protein J6590_015779 [Homalodisca vitripennis]|nr:hypothetical protein J6590_015779 [Homalodisca vitripennis]